MSRQTCFLSYSRRDAPAADLIHCLLSLYEPDIVTWRDLGMAGGVAWRSEIERNIDAATVFIALISDAYALSDECQKEFDRFYARLAEGDDVKIIPVRIDRTKYEERRLSSFQQIDFTGWITIGDRLVSDRLVPAILGRRAHGGKAAERAHPGDAVAVAAMTDVLIDFRTKLDSEQQSTHLVRLALSMVRAAESLPLASARLLTELSELFINKADYRGALRFNREALERLRSAGVTVDGLTTVDDEAKALLGAVLVRLSLIARKLKETGSRAYLDDALRVFEGLEDAISRSDTTAQVHRELGTYWQSRGDLARARDHFEASFELLGPLPTQRFHVWQAKIKLAQTELLAGEMDAANSHLTFVADAFDSAVRGESYGEMVQCQFLLTRVLLRTMRAGPRGYLDWFVPTEASAVRRDLATHLEVARRMRWRNELWKSRLMRLGWRLFRPIPRRLQGWIVLHLFRAR